MAKDQVAIPTLKVELKVFIHCCDGCRRKIKKVLRSIEGVFGIEIDPMMPKVTVTGNVDPQILIKKLCKAGKQAQVTKSEKVKDFDDDDDENKTSNINSNTKNNEKSAPNSSETTTKSVVVPTSSIHKTQAMPINMPNLVIDSSNEVRKHNMIIPSSDVTIGTPYNNNNYYYYFLYQSEREIPVFSQTLQPPTRVGDYFCEDNTMGCHIM
ncbi:hypothetical protein G4B88_029373 [Cannabis sativa]|uniref:HMA domain-containing protein n=2 Tax=Cannabis sativa TaxID=3483 RepID=A0A7J6G1W3_CANSA|nr:hypothetical protein G4B88_029373 [Cannabis sativa]